MHLFCNLLSAKPQPEIPPKTAKPSLLSLTSTEFMSVIFLSKAKLTKKYAHYMKCADLLLQISVTMTATCQQHEHIITKTPS
jgi:hypothetical protein